MNIAANLSIYSNTSLLDAMSIQPSVAKKFFDSKAFSDWSKRRESEIKTQVAIVDRVSGVIRAIGLMAKAIGKSK